MVGDLDDCPGIDGNRCEAETIARVTEIGQRVRRRGRGVRKDFGQFRLLRLNRTNQRRAQRHNRKKARAPIDRKHHSFTPCGPVAWRRATSKKVGAPPCREARSYFARAPAVKYQSCLSASANRPSISVRSSALVTGVIDHAGKSEAVSSKNCMTTFRSCRAVGLSAENLSQIVASSPWDLPARGQWGE